ncbi:DUF3164 family protein [Sinirhodobacter populi]|uniref:DUF3164 family protein n=1 Tax=Paenirhodobacter populi TaxID=2306993 RepID=A0A443K270_9RHOB|nr:DUF3164 family protein [Sinirhodobacter populi]RWR26822.1 DUF3164 family protein [Sinirhodobacter populi]
MTALPDNFVCRPDGSYVDINKLEPRKQLAHGLVAQLFPQAEEQSARLADLKRLALREMLAYRQMMLDDYEVQIGGPGGGFQLRSVCGTMMIKLEVAKQTTFGPEIEAAKALIDQFLETKLEGSSVEIKAIIEKVFKVNRKGRLDTYGILGLQEHKFDDPLWQRAMKAIEDAIIRDNATTYIRFYRVDPERKAETLVPLDLAKV